MEIFIIAILLEPETTTISFKEVQRILKVIQMYI